MDTDETGSSMLFQSERQLHRRWGLTSAAGSIMIVLPHTPTHEAQILCGPSELYTLNTEMETGQWIHMCLCLSDFTNANTQTHTPTRTHTLCGLTHPSLVPHLEKPQNQTYSSLFSITFLPTVITTQVYLTFSHSLCLLSLSYQASPCVTPPHLCTCTLKSHATIW